MERGPPPPPTHPGATASSLQVVVVASLTTKHSSLCYVVGACLLYTRFLEIRGVHRFHRFLRHNIPPPHSVASATTLRRTDDPVYVLRHCCCYAAPFLLSLSLTLSLGELSQFSLSLSLGGTLKISCLVLTDSLSEGGGGLRSILYIFSISADFHG